MVSSYDELVPMPVRLKSREMGNDPLLAKISINDIFYDTSGPIQPVSIDDLPSVNASYQSPASYNIFDGDKFAGGFGETQLYQMDYWTLRQRSGQLFRSNIYARGLLRRLVTNVINTGLTPVSAPVEKIIGLTEDQVVDWAEDIETQWELYSDDSESVDYLGQNTFGALQQIILREAYIEGDVLLVFRYNKQLKRTQLQVVSGGMVATPAEYALGTSPNGNRIDEGVELDGKGAHVAYYVWDEEKQTHVRIPAKGKRTGRLQATMVYASDRRYGESRGEPLLSILLQSLKEIDRYRDSAQRKAVITSLLALFITRNQDKVSSRPLANAALRKDEIFSNYGASTTEANTLQLNGYYPGITIDQLQVGEEPKAFGADGTDINFPVFEEAIVSAMAWCLEIPPEIARLAFSSNYSAAQAGLQEFKIFLNYVRKWVSDQVCKPLFREWVLDRLLDQDLTAPKLLDAFLLNNDRRLISAWLRTEWTGAIKPSTDPVKQVSAYKIAIKEGLITHERACRELYGLKYRTVIKRLKEENKLLAEANEPLLDERQVGRPAGGVSKVPSTA